MVDRRRELTTFAVFALVLLRLIVGWHFFREGTKKLEYRPHTGRVGLDFSSADFLAQAKGPLAKMYKSLLPNDHGWQDLLAAPKQLVPTTDSDIAKQSEWEAGYELRQKAAREKKETPTTEIPPHAPYREWEERIVEDWRRVLTATTSIPGMAEEQKKKASEAFARRVQQLDNYLAGETESIEEYQHELWRLAQWRGTPEAAGVPFEQQRIATKTTEATKTAAPWVSQVATFEKEFGDELRGILTPEQRANAATSNAFEAAVAGPQSQRLRFVDLAVTILTVSVGICLLLGLFTRTAALAGALFLISVIASQPPWLTDTVPTMPQIIEFASLLVLAGTRAGRWAGLDFFSWRLFGRDDA